MMALLLMMTEWALRAVCVGDQLTPEVLPLLPVVTILPMVVLLRVSRIVMQELLWGEGALERVTRRRLLKAD
jgi:hypothetical protein